MVSYLYEHRLQVRFRLAELNDILGHRTSPPAGLCVDTVTQLQNKKISTTYQTTKSIGTLAGALRALSR